MNLSAHDPDLRMPYHTDAASVFYFREFFELQPVRSYAKIKPIEDINSRGDGYILCSCFSQYVLVKQKVKNEMRLHTTNRLTDRELARIRILEQECRFCDETKKELFLSNELNFNKEMPCFFMLYQKNALCAVLTLFAPSQDTAELSALVLPDCRRKGYFKELLAAASKEISAYGIQRILFVHETGSLDAKNMIEKWHVDLSHSEYLLSLDREAITGEARHDAGLRIRAAEEKDLRKMAELNARAFRESIGTSYNLVKETFGNEKMLSYCAFLDRELIGVCNVRLEGYRLSIFGLCIAPGYQSRGYGKAFLKAILSLIREYSGEITLEVGSDNRRAFELYRRNGFQIKGQCDYYNYPI